MILQKGMYMNKHHKDQIIAAVLWSSVIVGIVLLVFFIGRTVGLKDRHGMVDKVAFEEAKSTLLVYYGADGTKDDIVLDCTSGRYTLPRESGQKFWIVEMAIAWNQCDVNKEIYTWPTFRYVPTDVENDDDGGHPE